MFQRVLLPLVAVAALTLGAVSSEASACCCCPYGLLRCVPICQPTWQPAPEAPSLWWEPDADDWDSYGDE